MDWVQLLQLAASAILIVAGALMLKRGRSQSGTLLLLVGLLLGVLGLDLMDYTPSPSEAAIMSGEN